VDHCGAEKQCRLSSTSPRQGSMDCLSGCPGIPVRQTRVANGFDQQCCWRVKYHAVQNWNPLHEAINASYSIAGAIIVLFLGWFVGQRLTYLWNVRQKRREFQLSASQQFYVAYGEFFATWKLWDRLDRTAEGFEERRWELHKRAAAAEAIIEGTLVKLSSELTLGDEQIDSLGRFRQAFQQLRQAIRKDCALSWSSSEDPEYKTFKILAIRVSALLASEWPKASPSLEEASNQLLKITSNAWENNWVECSAQPAYRVLAGGG